MKILVAPDSFKGSLTSAELCRIIRHGMEKVLEAEVIEMPISDGGEGFLESICSIHPYQLEFVNAKDPLEDGFKQKWRLIMKRKRLTSKWQKVRD